MRLLVLTQAVDTEDQALGFFHGWLAEFAKHFEKIAVVCLKEGEHALPANVRVVSLGKSAQGRPASGWEIFWQRVRYVEKFYRYVWQLSREYDAVFVHMNQEYVLLGALLWKFLGKRVYLWRNHYAGSVFTDLAVVLADGVFCTSKFSYTAKFKKTEFMPVGVDLEKFTAEPSIERRGNSVLFLARFAASKHPDVLVDALKMLKQKGTSCAATFVGSALREDSEYRAAVMRNAADLGETVHFTEGVPNASAPAIYSAHEIFVDLGESGMYNKTIFEAAACGCIVLAVSRDYAAHADPRLIFDGTAEGLASSLAVVLSLSREEKEHMKIAGRALAESHSLEALGAKLAECMRTG